MQKIHEKTEIKVSELVAFAGVSKSTWHEWRMRKGIETRHNHETPKLNWYTPEERTAVVKYVLTHKNFLYGYRYLAWQMVDENVAFVRPAKRLTDLIPSNARIFLSKAYGNFAKHVIFSLKNFIKRQGLGQKNSFMVLPVAE